MMDDLLPCPFCGGEAYEETFKYDDNSPTMFNNCCGNKNCPASYVVAEITDKQEAIKAWNTRTPDTMKDLQENIGDSDE